MDQERIDFEPGKVYRRREDIHEIYGGQRQGGISTPSTHPLVLLFTGETGSQFGYKDDFRPDGTFWYTGEGQIGDMKMDRGNAAIRDHRANDKAPHLFEYISRGRVRHIGEAEYLGHHIERRPDRNGTIRDALVFELEVKTNSSASTEYGLHEAPPSDADLRLWKRPLSEVRDIAMRHPPSGASETMRRVVTRQRSEAVRVYVLRRADGTCEGCEKEAPFFTKDNRPYLEPHHIHRLADGGPDDPRYVAALCPNCHQEIHHGKAGPILNQKVLNVVLAKEQ